MQITNLTESNVDDLLDKVEELKEENLDIEAKVFDLAKDFPSCEHPSNTNIMDELGSLKRKIELVFGDHVLISGVWTKVPK